MENKDYCPNCGKKELEKIKDNKTIYPWLFSNNEEWWGCLNCGNAFFKKIEIKG